MEDVARLAPRFAAALGEPLPNGCIEWAGKRRPEGYGLVPRGTGGGYVRAHRLAWMLAHGPIPPGMFVCHRCDHPPCVNVAHLFLGTNADNVRDMLAKGRNSQGEKQRLATETNRPRREAAGRAKLTEADVAGIRAALSAGEMHKTIASLFRVSRTTVGRIFRGVGRGAWPIQYGPTPPGAHAFGIGLPSRHVSE